jgi:hypothetical protein
MQLPGPVRAVVGLIAEAADEAKHLPDRAIELPMLAVSTALQMSLRAQQRYARFAARGDDVLNRRPPSDEAPPWATFDDALPDLRGTGLDDADPDVRARAASKLLDELLGTPAEDGLQPPPPAKKAPARRAASPRKSAAKRPAAKEQAGGEAGKSISRPRNSPPSRFDTVDE